jgi:uncharacterized protein
MIQAGIMNKLTVARTVDFGLYLSDGTEDILLPIRFAPKDAQPGDELDVFVYHDSENRLIATTQTPYGMVGDVVYLKAVDVTRQGAFLDWGLMKDLFVPLSQQAVRMERGGYYFVRIYLDEQTGRVAATNKVSRFISNHELTVSVNDPVQLLVYRRSELGYNMIINSRHWGLLYYDDVFTELDEGDSFKGFIKEIRPDNKIDVALGERGYKKVAGEEERILELLRENDGYLPYHDKSDPEDIYQFFGMSKKTFKMTLGALYKKQLVELTKTGVKLV